jgi:hypothetical protein
VDKIDKHINSIYRDVKHDSKEIQDLKEEMRSHLKQTVKELQENGISEDDSIRIAIDRFGEEFQIRSELAQVLHFQKFFAKNVLISSVIFLVLCIGFLVTSHFEFKDSIKRSNEMNYQIKIVESTFEKEGISGVDRVLRELFKEETKNCFTYVAIKQLPSNYVSEKSIGVPPGTDVFPGEIKYIYPDKIKGEYYSNRFGKEIEVNNTKYLLETGVKTSANTDNSSFYKGIGILFFAICWVLWIIWSIINIYRLGKLNTGWSILVLILGIAGYFIFLLIQKYGSNKVLS